MRRFAGIACWVALAVSSSGYDLKEFEKRISSFELPNGIRFVVMERHESPLVSFHTYVRAGSLFDPPGKSGIAKLMERMSYKGTPWTGSADWDEEKRALDSVETANGALERERAAGASQGRLMVLEARLRTEMSRAELYGDGSIFPSVLRDAGATNPTSKVDTESAQYSLTLPSNRVELWFLMESQRLRSPVFRRFYQEKQAMLNARKADAASERTIRLEDTVLAEAFPGTPLAHPTAGSVEDLAGLSANDALEFFEKNYTAGNLVFAVVGDVTAPEVKRLAEKYFDRIPKRPATAVPEIQPVQGAEMRRPLAGLNGIAIAYRRPNRMHPDDLVFDTLTGTLAIGKAGLLYEELVEKKKLAASVTVVPTFPSGLTPGLFVIVATPVLGGSIDALERGCEEILERLKVEPLDPAVLSLAKGRAMSGLLRQVSSNAGAAEALATFEAAYGDWHTLGDTVRKLEDVTAADIQRVAKEYFIPEKRIVLSPGRRVQP